MKQLLRRPRTWFIAVPVALLVLGLLGPYVWFNLVKDDPPPRLSFADVTTTTADVTTTSSLAATSTSVPTATTALVAGKTVTATTVTASPVEGSWRVGAGSVSGYRIGETVGVRAGEAVGRTDKVTGAMTINNTTVASGSWTVDMASVKSDEDRRDAQYRAKMEVDKYPTSTFVLTPVNFSNVPADGTDINVAVKGSLTLHGVTKPVAFTVKARRANGRIEVVGSIPVTFADYNIENPSNGYARTDDHGLVEFLLLFNHA